MWLVNDATLARMSEAKQAGFEVSADQKIEFEARAGNGPRGFSVLGEVAQISVTGLLTKNPDLFATLIFGNTSYAEIINALERASSDPSIKAIHMFVDSPGGAIDGLFETIDTLEAAKAMKPITVVASNAHSAAYALASAAGPITALSRGSQFGSVGTMASFPIEKEIVTLTNSESPQKNPDVTTEEGRATMVARLDEAYGLFVEAISRGRNTTAQAIKNDYGQGASFFADEALRRGMIDSIAPTKLSAASGQQLTTAQKSGQKKDRTMDVAEFKAQHPDLYKKIVEEERGRVEAHLTMGEQSGDLKTAFEAIRAGSDLSQPLIARYMAAALNRNDIKARQQESDAVSQVLETAKVEESKDAFKDQVMAKFMALQGVEANG